jgi:general secretion pathway protein H
MTPISACSFSSSCGCSTNYSCASKSHGSGRGEARYTAHGNVFGINERGCQQRFNPATAGFTLLEMLLVLSIIALASILVVPNMGKLDARTFSAQVRQATSLLNYARRTAVVRGQPSTATFYAAGLDEEDVLAPARNSVGSWESQGAVLRYQDSTEREIAVDDKIEISFYPEGGSTGGTLLLSFEQQQVRIQVDSFTGRIATESNDD